MPRAAVLVLVLFVGCGPAAPVLTVKERAGLAAALALDAIVGDAPLPPLPPPEAPDRCPSCTNLDGSPLYPDNPGYVGDGKVFLLCQECGGTTKKRPSAKSPAKVAKPMEPVELYASPPRDGRTYRKVCRGKNCYWEPVE